jgi:hypothetical protein
MLLFRHGRPDFVGRLVLRSWRSCRIARVELLLQLLVLINEIAIFFLGYGRLGNVRILMVSLISVLKLLFQLRDLFVQMRGFENLIVQVIEQYLLILFLYA